MPAHFDWLHLDVYEDAGKWEYLMKDAVLRMTTYMGTLLHATCLGRYIIDGEKEIVACQLVPIISCIYSAYIRLGMTR